MAPAALGAALAFQQRSEESSGGVSIASRLHEDVDHVAVLVHGAPEILSPALNGDEELVQMPGIAPPAQAAAQRPGVVGPKGLTPLPDRLVRDGDPAFGEQILDVAGSSGQSGGRARLRD